MLVIAAAIAAVSLLLCVCACSIRLCPSLAARWTGAARPSRGRPMEVRVRKPRQDVFEGLRLADYISDTDEGVLVRWNVSRKTSCLDSSPGALARLEAHIFQPRLSTAPGIALGLMQICRLPANAARAQALASLRFGDRITAFKYDHREGRNPVACLVIEALTAAESEVILTVERRRVTLVVWGLRLFSLVLAALGSGFGILLKGYYDCEDRPPASASRCAVNRSLWMFSGDFVALASSVLCLLTALFVLGVLCVVSMADARAATKVTKAGAAKKAREGVRDAAKAEAQTQLFDVLGA